MKHWDYYTPRKHSVAALHWTRDQPVSDLKDFCDGLVDAVDTAEYFQVYNVTTNTWHSFDYGDWIVDEPTGLIPMPHERFVQLYEQDSNGSEPRGND